MNIIFIIFNHNVFYYYLYFYFIDIYDHDYIFIIIFYALIMNEVLICCIDIMIIFLTTIKNILTFYFLNLFISKYIKILKQT